MKTKIVLLVGLVFVFSSIAVAQRVAAPEVVVRNLYAAQKRDATDPFFQAKSRARLDKFFAKQLADLIWNDASRQHGPMKWASSAAIRFTTRRT